MEEISFSIGGAKKGKEMTEEQKQRREERRLAIQQAIEDARPKCLPCPFCGDIPIVENVRTPSDPEFRIGCNCFVKDTWRERRLCVHTESFRDINLALEQWNKRKNAPEEAKSPSL